MTHSAAVIRKFWGVTPRGESSEIMRLAGEAGISLCVSSYGGIITLLEVPTRDRQRVNVVLGMDHLRDYTGNAYLTANPYFGAIVGRCANRIRGARFTLNQLEHRLTVNEPPNHLHGGSCGFDKVVWSVRVPDSSLPCVELSYTSPAGEEGYPGELNAMVRYSLLPPADLRIDYETRAGAVDTIANLTNHSYFNLNGAGCGDILDHELQISADSYLPLGPDYVPTGEIRALDGTDLDFRQPTRIGARLPSRDPQLQLMNGYTHHYVLNACTDSLMRAARVSSARHDLTMEVWTTEPGLQIYTASFLTGSLRGSNGVPFTADSALCLETQQFPDAINQPGFPSVVLPAGATRRSTTIYRFRQRSTLPV